MAVTEDLRYFERIVLRVKISIRNISRDFDVEAGCVNVSAGGVCVEAERMLLPGDDIEMWIHCGDGLAPIHRYGKIVWCRKYLEGLFKIGIKFKSLRFRGMLRLVFNHGVFS